MVKVAPWQGPSSAPVPPQGTPGGSGQLNTPMQRPVHWAPRHCLGCSSQPPPKSQISPPLTLQALPAGFWEMPKLAWVGLAGNPLVAMAEPLPPPRIVLPGEPTLALQPNLTST